MGIEFLLTAFVVTVSPGTGVVYTLAAGLARGSKAAVVAAFGCTLGIIPHLAAAIAGVAAVLHASAVAFQAFKVVGVLYLLYLAWQVVREKGAMRLDQKAEERPASYPRVIGTAVLVNALNPKLSIFFLAFLPQFTAPDDPHAALTMIRLGLVFMAMTFAVFTVYGLFAAKVRSHVISRPRVMAWMRRSFAAAFVGLGIRLAAAER
ncbi:LysE family translocator [Salininema proteolyticum]|uniref:LysE family translocator n=1 Tax=Salininema proteolyticum TaxID=1607685 RepID=A0ABV8TTN4_9ACTN